MGTKRTRDKKVGLFLIDNGSRYQKLLKREAERAARRHGLALDTVLSDNFAAQQSQDIMRFVHANLDRQVGVVAMTVSDSASSEGVSEDPVYRLARRVAVRGAGWVILNRDTEAQIHALRQEFPRVPIGMVTPDQKELGRIQGRQFRALLPRGGRVLYVLGMPHISSAQDRRTGMLEEVATAPIQMDEVDGL